MFADQHMHTHFSTDGTAAPQEMAEASVRAGLSRICFTDHHDIDFSPEGEFLVDMDAYLPAMQQVREEFRGRLEIGIGMEVGLMPGIAEKTDAFAARYPFDFVIGSMPALEGEDLYYRDRFPQYTDEAFFHRYFEEYLVCVREAENYDALGHLDYAVRYGIRGAEDYSYKKYAEFIDEILRILVDRGTALEVNSGGLRKGLGFPNPHPEILRRFRELGGERITVGSDAHRPEDAAFGFAEVRDLLLQEGFRYTAEYRGRAPQMCPLV